MERAFKRKPSVAGVSQQDARTSLSRPQKRKAGLRFGEKHKPAFRVFGRWWDSRDAGHVLGIRPLGDQSSESASGPVIISPAT
jgi:hypothetical protein